jgi:ADP-heptose:LPS heptosyltransferase/GT2 family glycosyltransferase
MSDNPSASAQTSDEPPRHCGEHTVAGDAADAALVDGPTAEALSGVDETSDAMVLIELDPGLTGGFIRNRFDITICGRVASDVPLAETRLQVGDWVTSAAYYGQPERPSGGSADAASARPRAFRFNLPRQLQGSAERCGFEVIARTIAGLEYSEQFEVDLDPIAEPPVSLVSGPSRASDGTTNRPHVVMYVERGAIDADGVLLVQGWAISLTPISSIQIFAGAERVGDASLGGDREDVAAAFNGYPNAGLSGFSLNLQLDEIDQEADIIRVQVVCSNGYGHDETIPVERVSRRHAARAKPRAEEPRRSAPPSGGSQRGFSLFNQRPAYQLTTGLRLDHQQAVVLAPGRDTAPYIGLASALPLAERVSGLAAEAAARAKEDASGKIEMYCDEAHLTGDGILSLNGWATCKAGIAQVRVTLDDNEVGLAVYGHERLDVGRIFPAIPMSHLSGFKFDQKVRDQASGQFTVRVIVCNMRNEQSSKELTVVATPLPDTVLGTSPAMAARTSATAGNEPTAEQAAEFRFELDSPVVTNGAATAAITGRLTVDGWLLSRSGIARFEVFLNDQRLGDAHYGLARQDVGAAFPEWPNALRAGFAFHCPPRSLKDGEHTIKLWILANSGQELIREFRITVKKSDDQQDLTGIRRRVPRVEADMMLASLAAMNYRPSYRFILRQDAAVDAARLGVTLDALRAQAYTDWAVLVLAEDEATAASVQAIIGEQISHLADRFTVVSPSDGDAWTAPLAEAANGRNVLHALLLPGDEPAADALLELAVAGGMHPQADMLYGDEVRLSPVSNEKESFFKPDFSPDLMLSTNYIGRPWVATAALLAQTGATAASLVSRGEYDLVLRCAETAASVHHLPKLLCQRGGLDLDTPEQERSALQHLLERRGEAGEVIATPIHGTWRVRRELATTGMVSIIIPTCAANGYIENIITTLRSKTAYRNFEIIVIDNIPDSDVKWKTWLPDNADKIVDIPGTFNWSIFNNRATEVAQGDYFLFLNDDMEVTHEDWLDALLEHVQRPEVGLAGPQLLYRDGKVQHAGMFLANNGIGRHAFRFAAGDEPCYFGLNLTQRNVMAVTGACMLVRREVFERLGGFDEAHQITNNDLDFCLRVHRAGLLTVFTPYASLIHYELASRAGMKDVFDLTHFDASWKTTFALGDPYFNPRLSRHADDYRTDDEPVQWVACGAPLFHKEEIERILVVKLDHIGDFVTALPPIRRLKRLFPHARLTVLAGPASRAFISLEPSIDEFIPFAFFHARSQLGEREVTREDYLELAQQLRPYRFDLAVDLRKHPSTRDVLKYTGARFLAGFDHLGQYPNLDIALDWDGDRTLQRKRSHVVDDLIGLVDAIAHATENDRAVMQPAPEPMPLSEMPDEVQALFVKPVVAIHPGAGNITKQWPTEHFSALIDLLIEKHDVNIMLVGGPDEVEIADALLQSGLYPDRMATMAGRTKLADLPRLLKTCVLYIGNDSGPKHIASAIGIATIGIHSGVVDPVEWGPIGVNAVALRRNMNCSPCYLANAEDCPRALACLRFLEPNLVYESAVLMLRPVQPVTEATNHSDG